tara:strand:+ start:361 stop:570 length:210 start_codon:yes stop_codon:yes gene_type:complete
LLISRAARPLILYRRNTMEKEFDLEKELAWLDDLHEELSKLKEKSEVGKDAHPYYLKPTSNPKTIVKPS